MKIYKLYREGFCFPEAEILSVLESSYTKHFGKAGLKHLCWIHLIVTQAYNITKKKIFKIIFLIFQRNYSVGHHSMTAFANR